MNNAVKVRKLTLGTATAAMILGMASSSIAYGSVNALKFMTASQSIPAGQCSAANKFERIDIWGNAQAVDYTTTVNVAATGATLYSDSKCTVPLASNVVIGVWGYYI